FWEQTVSALARHLGAEHPVVTGTAVCVDPRRQWRRWTSLWHNAAIRSVLQTVAAAITGPVRRGTRRLR
ncbi:MAG: hypothetical protein ACRDOH_25050, partial [Streptosporangiaceae bacterium]